MLSAAWPQKRQFVGPPRSVLTVLFGSFGSWCENATSLTDLTWSHLKVLQVEFGKLEPTALADVALAFGINV